MIDIAQWRANPNPYLDLNRDLIEDLGLYLKIGLDLDLKITGFGHHSLAYTSKGGKLVEVLPVPNVHPGGPLSLKVYFILEA